MNERYKDRSNGAIWERLNSQSDAIAEIAKSHAATDARLTSLETKFDDGIRRLGSSIDKISQPPAPTNWIGLSMLVLGLLAMFGGYALLLTAPMQEKIEVNRQSITNVDANTDSNESRLGRLEGRASAAELAIRDIDMYGPRRGERE